MLTFVIGTKFKLEHIDIGPYEYYEIFEDEEMLCLINDTAHLIEGGYLFNGLEAGMFIDTSQWGTKFILYDELVKYIGSGYRISLDNKILYQGEKFENDLLKIGKKGNLN